MQLQEKATNLFNIHPIISKVLINRGINDLDSIRKFLFPIYSDLYDPLEMTYMESAIEQIKKTILNKEKIFIYGHDDVDGITATVIIIDAIKFFAKTNGVDDIIVDYYIPNRVKEGYGINLNAVDTIAKKGTKLIITVDCGLGSNNAISKANDLGIDIIVTDHHQIHTELPHNAIVIHPNVADKSGRKYPFGKLAGAGVSYKLAEGLLGISPKNKIESEDLLNLRDRLLALCALGSIADKVPLQDENRVITKLGLNFIKITNNDPSLIAIRDALNASNPNGDDNITPKQIVEKFVGGINSCESIEGHHRAVDFFYINDINKAREEIGFFVSEGMKQKEISENAFQICLSKIKETNSENDDIIIVVEMNIPMRTMGYCASRLCKLYSKPIIIIGRREAEKKNGSTTKNYVIVSEARSPANFNLVALFSECKDLLIQYGGHKQAAGFSIEEKNIEPFIKKAKESMVKLFKPLESSPSYFVEAIIPDEILSKYEEIKKLAMSISLLEPFGQGNSRPIFSSEKIHLKDGKIPIDTKYNIDVLYKNDNDELEYINNLTNDYLINPIYTIVNEHNNIKFILKNFKK